MAANSLAQIGESAIEPLLAALKSPDGEIRRNAALALGWIKDPRAASALQQAFEKRDTEVIVGAYAYFIGRGEPGSEDVLIEALNKSGDLSMDKAFRECGNERLEQASRTWVPRTGNQRRGTYGGVWGHPW
jgi:HEAT repeat protein